MSRCWIFPDHSSASTSRLRRAPMRLQHNDVASIRRSHRTKAHLGHLSVPERSFELVLLRENYGQPRHRETNSGSSSP
jgi:hypothetical protein